jgi:serine/threonine protein kinase
VPKEGGDVSDLASSPRVVDGKYEIAGLLGEGGMAKVYEAIHRATGRRVALKVIAAERLLSTPGMVERFRREARVGGAIDSRYVAQILDAGVDPASGQPYIALELLAGEDLNRAIGRVGRMPADFALRIAAQACLGLQKAHEVGVTHRDIKPANLFLSRRDGEVVVKVLDFGLARVRDDLLGAVDAGAVSTSGAIIGSPRYMSPEQALGHKTLDERTDLWSLGVVLYEMLSGQTPTAGALTSGEIILEICTRPARPLREVARDASPEIEAIVHRALAREPKDRFSSVEAMYEAIRALLPKGHALEESMFPALPRRAAHGAKGELGGSAGRALHDDDTLTPEEDARRRAAEKIARDGRRSSSPIATATGSGERIALSTLPAVDPVKPPAQDGQGGARGKASAPVESSAILRATSKLHVAMWGDIFVLVDHGQARPQDYVTVGELVIAGAAMHPKGMGGLTIIPPDATPPSEDARLAMNRLMGGLGSSLRCFSWLVEGRGFQGAMVRAVLTGVKMLGRFPYEVHVSSEMGEALTWILRRLDGGDRRLPMVPEGVRAIEEQRRRAERDRRLRA